MGEREIEEFPARLAVVKILNKFGQLRATKESPKTARKAQRGGFIELTDQEKERLEKATRLKIRRLGEYETTPNLDQISLMGLPPI